MTAPQETFEDFRALTARRVSRGHPLPSPARPPGDLHLRLHLRLRARRGGCRMSVALAVDTLTRDDARALTEEVKRDAAVLRAKLLRLYEGRAHEALGYSSWGDYYTAEFGQTAARGYQLLDAARVSEPIQQLLNEPPPNEAQARELVPLKD